MKTLALFFLLLSSSIFAQVNFEKGYYIDKDDNKIECYIKNLDWNTAPDEIFFKLDLDNGANKISTSSINEFQVYNTDQYYKRLIVEELEFNNNNVARGLLFKVLLEGEASIYEISREKKQFFYGKKGKKVKPLSHKKSVDNKSRIKEDNSFRRALFDELKCSSSLNLQEFRSLKYNANDLVEIFEIYNLCLNKEHTNFYNKRTKFKIKLSLNAGAVSFPNFKNQTPFKLLIVGGGGSGEIEGSITNGYNSQASVAFGVTTEFLLPFSKNKWSIVSSPSFISFKESTSLGTNSEFLDVIIDLNQTLKFSYIELPLGIRHYFRLSEKNTIFLNVGIVYNILMSSDFKEDFTFNDDQVFSVDVERRDTNTNISSNSGFYLGLGFTYSKFALTINYYPQNSISKKNEYEVDASGMFNLIASFNIL